MASDETTDPHDAEIARLRSQLAAAHADNAALRAALEQAEALNRINVCAYCQAQFQRTPEDVRRQAQHILCCEKNLLTVALHRVAGERDEARAQLAAAQAENVALRGALEMAHEVVASVSDSWPIAFERVTEALANPAPGAPLLDAVRRLVEAAAHAAVSHERAEARLHAVWGTDQVGAAYAEAMGEFDGSMAVVAPALAAVRAVLSRAQDTAGISRGGDSE